MGKHNILRKRERRHKQKMKKTLKCKSNKETFSSTSGESSSSLGSPSSPPSSPPNEAGSELQLYGIDHSIFTYKEDSNNNFETDDGKHLSGELLLHHLHKSNKTLAEKAFYYQRKFEEAQTRLYQKDASCAEKISNIRHFYRDLLYYSNRQSATMVKKALEVAS